MAAVETAHPGQAHTTASNQIFIVHNGQTCPVPKLMTKSIDELFDGVLAKISELCHLEPGQVAASHHFYLRHNNADDVHPSEEQLDRMLERGIKPMTCPSHVGSEAAKVFEQLAALERKCVTSSNTENARRIVVVIDNCTMQPSIDILQVVMAFRGKRVKVLLLHRGGAPPEVLAALQPLPSDSAPHSACWDDLVGPLEGGVNLDDEIASSVARRPAESIAVPEPVPGAEASEEDSKDAEEQVSLRCARKEYVLPNWAVSYLLSCRSGGLLLRVWKTQLANACPEEDTLIRMYGKKLVLTSSQRDAASSIRTAADLEGALASMLDEIKRNLAGLFHQTLSVPSDADLPALLSEENKKSARLHAASIVHYNPKALLLTAAAELSDEAALAEAKRLADQFADNISAVQRRPGSGSDSADLTTAQWICTVVKSAAEASTTRVKKSLHGRSNAASSGTHVPSKFLYESPPHIRTAPGHPLLDAVSVYVVGASRDGVQRVVDSLQIQQQQQRGIVPAPAPAPAPVPAPAPAPAPVPAPAPAPAVRFGQDESFPAPAVRDEVFYVPPAAPQPASSSHPKQDGRVDPSRIAVVTQQDEVQQLEEYNNVLKWQEEEVVSWMQANVFQHLCTCKLALEDRPANGVCACESCGQFTCRWCLEPAADLEAALECARGCSAGYGKQPGDDPAVSDQLHQRNRAISAIALFGFNRHMVRGLLAASRQLLHGHNLQLTEEDIPHCEPVQDLSSVVEYFAD